MEFCTSDGGNVVGEVSRGRERRPGMREGSASAPQAPRPRWAALLPLLVVSRDRDILFAMAERWAAAALPSPMWSSHSWGSGCDLQPPAPLLCTQFLPCKPSRAVRARAALMAAFEGATGGVAAAGSPCAIADGPCAPSTASQPSSATSSLAAALADLQVASRQSSENDLGDRSKVLAALGMPGGGAAGPPPARQHLRSPSRNSEDDGLLAAAYTPISMPLPREEDGMCSPQLIGAVRTFDSQVLRRLTPIKTRSKAPPGGTEPAAARGDVPPSPAAPYAESLASPFYERGGMKPKQLAPAARPVIYHSRSSSITAPGAYNPYDLTAAALSSGATMCHARRRRASAARGVRIRCAYRACPVPRVLQGIGADPLPWPTASKAAPTPPLCVAVCIPSSPLAAGMQHIGPCALRHTHPRGPTNQCRPARAPCRVPLARQVAALALPLVVARRLLRHRHTHPVGLCLVPLRVLPRPGGAAGAGGPGARAAVPSARALAGSACSGSGRARNLRGARRLLGPSVVCMAWPLARRPPPCWGIEGCPRACA